MDPNANLREQDEIANIPLLQRTPEQILRLNELRRDLFTWLRNGGFEPTWALYPRAARYYGHYV